MNADNIRSRKILSAFIFIFLFTSCAPPATSTIFVPPTQPVPTLVLPTTMPIASPTPLLPTVAPTTGPSTNDLNFIDDVTVEDGTIVPPGSSVDKQWLVTNRGSCNWDASYHMKWIGGDPLGAATEQALYPARAGSQATIRILFTAPTAPGTYPSRWQAYGPDGVAFGDSIYIEIVISP